MSGKPPKGYQPVFSIHAPALLQMQPWWPEQWVLKPVIQLGFLLGPAQHQSPPVLQAQLPQLSWSTPVDISSQILQAVGCETEGSLEMCQRTAGLWRVAPCHPQTPNDGSVPTSSFRLFVSTRDGSQAVLPTLHPDKWEIPSVFSKSVISLQPSDGTGGVCLSEGESSVWVFILWA